MTLIIGFGNRARHGKDTAAQAIVDYYNEKAAVQYKHSLPPSGPSVKIYKYATALYAEVNDFLKSDTGKRWLVGEKRPATFAHILTLPDWVQPDPNPEVSALAPYGKHPKLLQWWGSELRRTQDVNYWVKKMFADLEKDKVDIALVTDVRFPNEAI